MKNAENREHIEEHPNLRSLLSPVPCYAILLPRFTRSHSRTRTKRSTFLFSLVSRVARSMIIFRTQHTHAQRVSFECFEPGVSTLQESLLRGPLEEPWVGQALNAFLRVTADVFSSVSRFLRGQFD